jgi:exonuclease III
MGNNVRVITWNCQRAIAGRACWDYLLELSPDIALLQEVSEIPKSVLSLFSNLISPAMGKSGFPQRFGTAILVKGRIGEALNLTASESWVQAELERFTGNLVAHQVLPDNGPRIKVVSVYSPAWPVDRNRLEGIDVSKVRLTQNKDVWVADLLWASIQKLKPEAHEYWIIAGDFNLSETFDLWKGGPRGNREYLDRMQTLGLCDCLRNAQGVLTPTFKNPSNGVIKHQMDHLFATDDLVQHLTVCYTGSRRRVFDQNLSDHLPIIADFCLPSCSN